MTTCPVISVHGSTESGSIKTEEDGTTLHDRKLVILEKCALCGSVATGKCSQCHVVFYCSPEHQKEDWPLHKSNCGLFRFVKTNDGAENTMIALREIPEGTDLLVEYPILTYINPDKEENLLHGITTAAGTETYYCLGCEQDIVNLSNPHYCSQCKIPLCSVTCEDSYLHRRECRALEKLTMVERRNISDIRMIHEDVIIFRLFLSPTTNEISTDTPEIKKVLELSSLKKAQACIRAIESYLLQSSHSSQLKKAFPISLQCCDGNAQLVVRLYATVKSLSIYTNSTMGRKALYNHLNYATHDCVPNADIIVDDSCYHRLTLKSRRAISAGDLITCDVNLFLYNKPTLERREILKKSFNYCTCTRCTDPRELQSHLSSVICPKCQNGSLLRTSPLKRDSQWKCDRCRHSLCQSAVQLMTENMEKEVALMVRAPNGTKERAACCNQLSRFLLRNRGQTLHPNHFLIQRAASLLASHVSHFIGDGAQLFLRVVGRFPRASLYTSFLLDDALTRLEFLECIRPGISVEKGTLAHRIAVAQFALALSKQRGKSELGTSYMWEVYDCITWSRRCQENLRFYPPQLKLSCYGESRALEKLLWTVHGAYISGRETDLNLLRKTIHHLIQIWEQRAVTLGLGKTNDNSSSSGHARKVITFASLLTSVY